MAHRISDEADRLAREPAEATGESLTVAVTEAIRMRLALTRGRRRGVVQRLLDISERSAGRPRRDDRPEDEILGFDERGRPS